MTDINLRKFVKPYAHAVLWRAIVQIINTTVPYVALIVTMGWMIHSGLHYIFVVLLAIPTGAFMVRLFILFHDCTHQSFFTSRRANVILGTILGVITFTPYKIWQAEHNRHHGTVGNLDERGTGDVWTMTVNEYQASSKWRQVVYQVYRNPVFLFLVAPFFLFAVLHRLPSKKFNTANNHLNLMLTNVGIVAIMLITGFTIGFHYYFMIQIPVLLFASVIGVWLFFVQHQFEDVYWKRYEQWDLIKAAIEGSSFYKLPIVLEWISGNIGYHHIHHLNAKVPNYRLKSCYKAIKGIAPGRVVTLLGSFKLALLNLYDENEQRLITFREFKKKRVESLT